MQLPQTRPSGGRILSLRRRDVLFLSLAAAVIAFDQLTKHLVRAYIDPGDTFPDGWAVRLVNVSNTGAAFGILQNQGAFLVITSLIGVVAILLYYMPPSVLCVDPGPGARRRPQPVRPHSLGVTDHRLYRYRCPIARSPSSGCVLAAAGAGLPHQNLPGRQ
jgi:hypothetical protein